MSKETRENEEETAVQGEPNPARRRSVLEKIDVAVVDSYKKHGCSRWGRHEAYGILLEEVDEVWDEVRANGPFKLLEEELIHVALVCVRYLETEPRFLEEREE